MRRTPRESCEGPGAERGRRGRVPHWLPPLLATIFYSQIDCIGERGGAKKKTLTPVNLPRRSCGAIAGAIGRLLSVAILAMFSFGAEADSGIGRDELSWNVHVGNATFTHIDPLEPTGNATNKAHPSSDEHLTLATSGMGLAPNYDDPHGRIDLINTTSRSDAQGPRRPPFDEAPWDTGKCGQNCASARCTSWHCNTTAHPLSVLAW